MTSPLEALANASTDLHREAFSESEYAGLLQSGRARLTDASKSANSIESRFDLAYNASHALALAALRKHGYRSGKRYLVFQALQHTLGVGPEVWRILDKCHRLRNQGEYEGFLDVDERLVTDLIDATSKVLALLLKE
jgi:hypothetical protein